MGYGEFASAAGRWRSHDAGPCPRHRATCTHDPHPPGALPAWPRLPASPKLPASRTLRRTRRRTSRRAGPRDANPDASGRVERCEYTPGVHPPRRGQRTVYKKAGIDDALTTAPLVHSQRVETDTGRAPYGLCDVGHQGLMHDEQFGLVYNRNRYLDPRTGRWSQRDFERYVDGMSLYEYVRSRPALAVDPSGMALPKEIKKRLQNMDYTWQARKRKDLWRKFRERKLTMDQLDREITKLMERIHKDANERLRKAMLEAIADPNATLLDRKIPLSSAGNTGGLSHWDLGYVVHADVAQRTDGKCECDWSKSKVLFVTVAVALTDEGRNQGIVLEDPHGRPVEIHQTEVKDKHEKSNIYVHESWHIEGVPDEVIRYWDRRGVILKQYKGFKGGAERAFNALRNELTYINVLGQGPGGKKITIGANDKPKCMKLLRSALERHFLSPDAQEAISEEGYWHTAWNASGSRAWYADYKFKEPRR